MTSVSLQQQEKVMANTDVTKTKTTPPQHATDIFGAMRGEMDRLFERFEHGLPRWPALFARQNGHDWMVPELDLRDNGKQLTIEVDLPGVDEKDVTVTLTNGVLTIKGEKKSEREEKQDSYYLAERSYGAFERSVRLPDTIDESKLEARFDKGVLKVIAQKRPEAVKADRKIEIKKS
jgi:HSP20 family protein